MPKITQYEPLAHPAPEDLLVVVDVSDTAMSPAGTDKSSPVGGLPFLPTTGGPLTGPLAANGGITVPGRVISASASLGAAESTVYLNGPDLVLSLLDASTCRWRVVTVKLTFPFTTGTIVPFSGQAIDGNPSYQMASQWQWVTLQSDGSNWLIVGAKPGGLLTIPVTSLPSGTANQAYTARLTASGGWPGYTWSVKSGSLPDGVSLSAGGVFSGTPTVAATSSFTIQVTDSIGTAATASLSITVDGGILLVQRGALVNATNGASVDPVFLAPTTLHNHLIAHIGGNGSAPITTDADGWVIAGSPRHPVAYKEDCGDNETPPVFACSNTSDLWAYLEEWKGVEASGSVDQVTFSSDGSSACMAAFPDLSTIPGELLVGSAYWNGSNTGGAIVLTSFTDNIGGTITGTLVQGANAFGQYYAGVSGVAGPTGSVHNQLGLSLSVFAGGDLTLVSFKPAAQGPPGDPIVTTASPLPDGSTDQPYTAVLAAEDGVPPYAWSVSSGALPAGLTISSVGVISGSPTVAGTFSFTVRATDSISDSGTAVLGLTVAQTPAPTFTTTAFAEPGSRSQGYVTPQITGPTQLVSVNNNVWSPVPGARCALSVVDPSDWWLIANFPAGNTQVSAFPSNDMRFGELPLSSFTKIVSSYDEVMNSNPGTQAWAAYDIWLDNWAWEIMIHHDLARFNPYDSAPLARGISFGGSNGVPVLAWDLHLYGSAEYVWQPANNAFNVQVGSVDILQMLTWMIANNFLPAVNTLTAIGYGWELCSTGGIDEFFKVNSFTLNAVYG